MSNTPSSSSTRVGTSSPIDGVNGRKSLPSSRRFSTGMRKMSRRILGKQLTFAQGEGNEILMADIMYKKRSGLTGVATGFAASLFHHDNAKEKMHGGRLWIMRYFVLYANGTLAYYDFDDDFQEELTNLAISRGEHDQSFLNLRPHAEMEERGTIDLFRVGAQLRLVNYGEPEPDESDSASESFDSGRGAGARGSNLGTGNTSDNAPTPYAFEVGIGAALNPNTWQSWTLCASNRAMFYQWTNAIRDAMYSRRGDKEEGSDMEYDDWTESDNIATQTQIQQQQLQEPIKSIIKKPTGDDISTLRGELVSNFKRIKGEAVVQMSHLKLALGLAIIQGIIHVYMGESMLLSMFNMSVLFSLLLSIYGLSSSFHVFVDSMMPVVQAENAAGYRAPQTGLKRTPHRAKTTKIKHIPPDMRVAHYSAEEISATPDLEHYWAFPDESMIHMRIGPDYKKNKQKAQTKPSLFRGIAIDLLESEKKVMQVMHKLEMPLDKTVSQDLLAGSNIPRLFIINFQVPRPATLAYSSADGPGYNFPMYYTPSDDLVQSVKDMVEGKPVEPAVKLLNRWFKESLEDNSWKERLKLVSYVLNPEDCGMPGWTTKFNGKPVMIRKSGVVSCDSERGIFEVDIDLRHWSIMTRQAISALLPRPLRKMKVVVAFVIQGDENDELPERCLVATQLCHIDTAKAIFYE